MMPKIKKRKKIQKKRLTTRGGVEIIILIFAVIFGFIIGGGLFGQNRGNSPIGFSTSTTCCDTGDGDACQPQRDESKNQVITFNGERYGLLRTNSVLTEGNLHLKDSGITTPDGKPIILNSSDTHAVDNPAVKSFCNRPDPIGHPKDLYFKKNPPDPYMFMKRNYTNADIQKYCDAIPNDNLIFICKQNCTAAACTWPNPAADISCYGTDKTVYDAYYKISEYDSSGMPDFIKNCDKNFGPDTPAKGSGQKIILPTDYPGKTNLQLRTFTVEQEGISIPWLSPLCKPAIYLYPTTTTNVNVKVAPVGKMLYTDPQYPQSGWDVQAQPNGILSYQNKSYDYLYYEAEIPDSNIEKPDKGFVVAKNDLASFLTEILPKLSLNKKEADEFKNYWIKALPDSPYYFIGIVSQSNLNSIAPLSISPTPNTVIRVTLYFEALENKIDITQPVITPIKRSGFTVVEWGGIFKKDKNHPFSCFM